jgi:hypothetical protein
MEPDRVLCEVLSKFFEVDISPDRVSWSRDVTPLAGCKNLFLPDLNHRDTPIKCKAVPLQAWSGPEGSRKLRVPDYMSTAQDGGKVVSLTHRSPLPPGNTPGTHFC